MKPEMLELEQNDAVVSNLVASGNVKVVVPTEENRNAVIEAVKEKIWKPWMDSIGDDAEKVINQINE